MPLLEEPIHSLHVSSPILSRLTDFPVKYSQRLQRAGFTTASEIILITPESLRSQTGLSSEEVQDVYRRLSEICSPQVSTVSARLTEGSKQGFITLGSADLDRVFGSPQGGIPTGMLTEIAGESACGKTCLALQLSLNVQLPHSLGGLLGGCIYLCTESAFPTRRLHEMASGLCARVKNILDSLDPETQELIQQELRVESLMENVHLTRVHDPQALIHTIHYYLPGFLGRQNESKGGSQRPIRLIVLDSIGAIFRTDLDPSRMSTTTMAKEHSQNNAKFRMTERAAEMNQVADGLKELGARYGLAVVVVNQVSDVMAASSSSSSELVLPRPVQKSVGRSHGFASLHPSPLHSSGSTVVETGRKSSPPNNSPSPLPPPISTPASTPESTPLLATPTSHLHSAIPLLYHHQARHFTGQKVTQNRKEAALGIHWTNAINQRIMLNKLHSSIDPISLPKPLLEIDNHPHNPNPVRLAKLGLREAVLVFSPLGFTPLDHNHRAVQFVIHSRGIVSVNEFL
ncbi:hypothetical protein PGT21_010891 [Puccinia graminis f. sp. tritici]|uniref:RecA family profile 1 domain-containing protein n=1 Tax=Puccinia graminis f. sp. tritici TaxID=56615 RepID=A0A5B0PRA0_PUCGR|nr:hypothetical protein PGT21_010891 [Puccinia graminis f. sp. tritici]